MDAELANQVGNDPTAQLLLGLVTDACSITLQRVAHSALDRSRRSKGRVDVLEALAWGTREFTPSIANLAAMPTLAADSVSVRRALGARQTRTVFQQIVAATLLDEFEERREDLTSLLTRSMGSQGVNLPEAESCSLLEAVHQLAQSALSKITSTPQSRAVGELAARTVLLQATLESIRTDVSGIREHSARDNAVDLDWIHRYRAQAVRRHGVIIPPDNNKRTPVPIADIYVPGRVTGPVTSTLSGETVYSIIDSIDRHVILGDPGGGKSTAINAIAHRIASEDDERLPFVVVLRDFGAVMTEDSISGYIEKTVAARYETPPPPAGLVEEMLRQGRAVVLLDGLDELLDPTKRRAMSEKVELFSTSYPAATILVTSRRVGYAEARLEPTVFQAVELGSYTDEDVTDYAKKWFGLNVGELQLAAGTRMDDVVDAFLAESATISDLRSNPLLLALLCIIYRGQNYLPRNRVGIYEKCTELLFETWDRSRGLTYDFSFDSYIDAALKHLAFWMFTNDEAGRGVGEDELVAEIAAFFADEAYETEAKAAAAAKAFIGFCKGRAWVLTEAGLTPEGVPLFTFAHRTFLEFYAAAQLTRKFPEPEKLAMQLIKRASRNEWDTLGQLSIQLINRSVVRGAERTVSRMIASAHAGKRTFEYRLNTMLFVGRCLQDLPPSPSLLRIAFPRLAALVLELFEQGDDSRMLSHQLEGGLGSLFRQDVGGEAVLLSELRTFIGDPASRTQREFYAALLVARSCLQNADEAGLALFREVFLDGWSSKSWVEYESLRVGYFTGCLDFSEIVGMVTEVGGFPLDMTFANSAEGEPFNVRGHQCMAYPMIGLASIWSAADVARIEKMQRKWFGSLADEVGRFLLGVDDEPLAQRRELDIQQMRSMLSHRARVGFKASSAQEVATLVHACVAVEMLEPDTDLTVLDGLECIALDETIAARAKGAWGADSTVARLDDSNLRRRLVEWAAKRSSLLA